jgi:hypothetical protein
MRVIAIQKNFVGGVHLVTPTRTFVREGHLLKVCRKVEKQRYPQYIIKGKRGERERERDIEVQHKISGIGEEI